MIKIDVKFRTKIKQPHKTPIKTKFSLQCKNPLKQNKKKNKSKLFYASKVTRRPKRCSDSFENTAPGRPTSEKSREIWLDWN